MSFAKHETFYIREGWLYKGMDAIQMAADMDDWANAGVGPNVFLDQDGPERLGIGRNMVKALRYWMQATGLATEEKAKGRTSHRLTDFGQWIWEHDKFLEDDATLWLIHYHLVCQADQATSWYWFFNHFNINHFESDTCFNELSNWVISTFPHQDIASSSLKKDVDCLLKTYTSNETPTTPENLHESPLSRLGLLSYMGRRQPFRYQREHPSIEEFPSLVFLYVIMREQRKKRPKTKQVSLGQVLREPGNVGRVFHLKTALITDMIANLKKHYPRFAIKLVRTAGLDELDLPDVAPDEILACIIEALKH